MAFEKMSYTEEAVQRISETLGVPAKKREIEGAPTEFLFKLTDKKLRGITYVRLCPARQEVSVGIGSSGKNTVDYHHFIFENIDSVYFYPTKNSGKNFVTVIFENKDHKHLQITPGGWVFYGTFYSVNG